MLPAASSAACSACPPGHLIAAPQKCFRRAAPGRRLACRAAQGGGGVSPTPPPGPSGGPSGAGCELPPELELRMSDDGKDLIDASGKVVNEFGATRFDVAVQAMRGEFDPPAHVENTEHSQGLLLDSLTQFPAVYDFQLVVKQALPAGDSARLAPAQLLAHYRQLIADTTAADIPLEQCTAKERLGGKFVSLSIPARVQAAHVLDLVWSALADDPAVLMKY